MSLSLKTIYMYSFFKHQKISMKTVQKYCIIEFNIDKNL